ncbi:MAG: amidohydrolase family protein [Litorimonas sp.]
MPTKKVRLDMAATIAVVVVAMLAGCTRGDAPNDRPDLVIRDVSLFDSRTGAVVADQSVFIDKGVILAIRDVTGEEVADQVLDGGDRLLAPGLIDTHIHMRHQANASRDLGEADWPRLARTYLDHGVTTVAEMGQPPAWVPTLLDWEANPVATRPDMVLVAGSISSTHDWDTSPPPHHVMVSTEEEAREQVRIYHRQGAQRIKLYWKLERDHLGAALDEAERLGMRAYGHIDNGYVNIADALDEGLRHYEHIFTLSRSVSSPDPLIELIRDEVDLLGIESLDEWTRSLSLYHDIIERTPELRQRMDALIDRLADADASISTALNILAANAQQSDVYSGFDPYPPRQAPDIRPEFVDADYAKAAFLSVMVQARRAHERGVRLRIGTDANNGGAAALSEMTWLARAGIPVADVLQIATRNGAEALGIGDRAGLIDVGRAADLVLFDADPFESHENFQAGVTTVKSGIVHNPARAPIVEWLRLFMTDSPEAAREWLAAHPDVQLHPTDLSSIFHGYVHEGNADAARHVLAQMRQPSTRLQGDRVEDYVYASFIRRAGYRFIDAGEGETATALFKLLLDVHPDDVDGAYGLADSFAVSNQYEKALTAYRNVLDLDPGNSNALLMIERIIALEDSVE